MPSRLFGLPEELRLEIEQNAPGITPHLAELMIGEAARQAQAAAAQDTANSLREIQSIVGPHGSLSRVQSGGVRIAPGLGIGIFSEGVFKTQTQPNGTFIIGSNIEEPGTTTEIFFTEDTDYNGETFGAGDMLIGDNSAANVRYDASEGRLEFRGGTTVQAYIDTDGSIKAGEGTVQIFTGGITIDNDIVGLSFGVTDPTKSAYLKTDSSDNFHIVNRVEGKVIRLTATHTGDEVTALDWREDAASDNVSQLNIAKGTAGGKLSIDTGFIVSMDEDQAGRAAFGFDHFIDFLDTATGTGSATVWFNERGKDIDVVIKDAADNEVFRSDASAGTVAIAGIASGTYTPTLTLTTNLDAAVVSQAFTYIRVGNFVMAAGGVTADPTATANTVLGISLPIASNFSANFDGTGNGTSQLTNMTGNLQADTTNDRMILTFQAVVTTNTAWRVVFMYEVK